MTPKDPAPATPAHLWEWQPIQALYWCPACRAYAESSDASHLPPAPAPAGETPAKKRGPLCDDKRCRNLGPCACDDENPPPGSDGVKSPRAAPAGETALAHEIDWVYAQDEETGLYCVGYLDAPHFREAAAAFLAREVAEKGLDPETFPPPEVSEVRHEVWRDEVNYAEGMTYFRPAKAGEPGAYEVTCYAFDGPDDPLAAPAPAAAPASPPPASLSIQAAQLGIRSPLTAEPAPASPPGDLGALLDEAFLALAHEYDGSVTRLPAGSFFLARRAAVLAWGERLKREVYEQERRIVAEGERRAAAESEVSRLRADRDAARAQAFREAARVPGRFVFTEVRGLAGLTLTGAERDDWIVRATGRKVLTAVAEEIRALASRSPGSGGAAGSDQGTGGAA